MKRITLKTAAVLLMAGIFASPSLAQFIGYTSPQTVQAAVMIGQTTPAVTPAGLIQGCVPVNGTPCAVPNVGQNNHSITYTISSPCTTGFSMDLRIEASNNGSTWFSISEDATDQNSGSIQGSTTGGLTATGSYPAYRINLVSIACASGQTPAVTVNYSGTSSGNPTATGIFYQSTPYRKIIVQNQPTTTALNPVTINAPNGNTAGALYIACYTAATGASANCPTSLVISVSGLIAWGSAVGGGGGGNISSGLATYSPAAVSAPIIQLINVPAISINFQFSGSGTAGVNWSAYYVSNFTSLPNFVGDPCQSPGSIKQAARNTFAAAGTTQIISASPGQVVYVCSIAMNMIGTTAADTLQLEGGTGTNCATVNSTMTPVFSSGILTSGSYSQTIGYGGTVTSNQVSNAVCAVTTVGTGPSIALLVTFVQQ